jgi:hypothetical protein
MRLGATSDWVSVRIDRQEDGSGTGSKFPRL